MSGPLTAELFECVDRFALLRSGTCAPADVRPGSGRLLPVARDEHRSEDGNSEALEQLDTPGCSARRRAPDPQDEQHAVCVPGKDGAVAGRQERRRVHQNEVAQAPSLREVIADVVEQRRSVADRRSRRHEANTTGRRGEVEITEPAGVRSPPENISETRFKGPVEVDV